ncbi:MAG: LrgB family protein [Cyanobacteria bacterium P01_B01_bin.77]
MDNPDLAAIWVYLSASPLLALTITLVTYNMAHRLYVYSRHHPLLNPVVTSVAALISFLLLTDTTYDTYFAGGQFIHFLLGPATVALAIPLYQQVSKLKKLWLPIMLALMTGVIINALSVVLIARLLGASAQTQISLAPKSVTAPVAMGISKQIGGLPTLTAAVVVLTGILGATLGPKLLNLMHIQDDSVKGIAIGASAHGLGTARSFQVSAEMGAFSGLAMALSALVSALVIPWLLSIGGIL